MKFLKFLLVIFLLIICIGLAGVFFQNIIISQMTRTDKSEFINSRYSISTNELIFDNFVVNGKNLGKGRAKVGLERTGMFGLVPKIKLSEMKLENLDLNTVYTAPYTLIDGFMEKIDLSEDKGKILEKTSEEYIKDSTTEIAALNSRIDDFMNNKVKEGIEKTNKLKEDYVALTDLKGKIEKISELNKEATPLVSLINNEKEKLEYTVSDIEANKGIMLSNLSEELKKLVNIISLNDISNINSYIFLDKKTEIVQSLNQALKTTELIDEIKNIPINISDITINDGKVKVLGLNGKNTDLTGEILLDNNTVVTLKGTEKGYNLDYNINELTVNSVLEKNKKIKTVITYEKKDILEGKSINLVSELIFENNSLQNINKTSITEEEKILLSEKIKTMETSRYDEIMNNYLIQIAKIDELVSSVYSKKEKLDKVQKELLMLGMIIKPEDIMISTEVQQNQNENSNNDVKKAETGNNRQTENLQQNKQNPKEQMQEILNKITDKK